MRPDYNLLVPIVFVSFGIAMGAAWGSVPGTPASLEPIGQFPMENECGGTLDPGQLSRLAVLCAQVEPADGRIWMDDDQEKGCWCRCPGTAEMTLAQAQERHRERVSRDISRFAARAKRACTSDSMHLRMRGVAPEGQRASGGERSADRVSAAAAVTATVAADDRYAMLEELVELFQEQYPIFLFETESESEEIYPWNFFSVGPRTWTPGDGELAEAERMTIMFPKSFVEHPRTGRALMAFLLAHEISHALGPWKSCPSGMDMVCEGDCDFYAADIVLRTVFSGPEYLRISRKAERQLLAFDQSYGIYDCGWSLMLCPEAGCQCGWPPILCRTKTIKAARRLNAKPPCVENWYTGAGSDCKGSSDCEE